MCEMFPAQGARKRLLAANKTPNVWQCAAGMSLAITQTKILAACCDGPSGASVAGQPDKYFDILQKIAEAVDPVSRARLAACLVYKNQIISIGTNKNKTHPIARRFSKHEEAIYLHAEVDSIKNALKNISVEELSACSMYVLRVKRPERKPREWIRGSAKPCIGCMKAIAQFDIKNVYYTTEGGNFECL